MFEQKLTKNILYSSIM